MHLFQVLQNEHALISQINTYLTKIFFSCLVKFATTMNIIGNSMDQPNIFSHVRGMPGRLSGGASAFGPGHDPGVLGSSPASGLPHGACFSLCLCGHRFCLGGEMNDGAGNLTPALLGPRAEGQAGQPVPLQAT